jgi:hypothetical protein
MHTRLWKCVRRAEVITVLAIHGMMIFYRRTENLPDNKKFISPALEPGRGNVANAVADETTKSVADAVG